MVESALRKQTKQQNQNLPAISWKVERRNLFYFEKGPSIKDVRIKGGDGGSPNADSCGQGGGGGWWNEDVGILKNFASLFLKLFKQGIVYVIESRWHYLTTPKSYLGIEN